MLTAHNRKGIVCLTSICVDTSTDPDSPRVFEMLRQHYDEFEFLPHKDFCPMSVYIRRSNQVDEQY